jgi:hypothetical protein
MNMICLFFGGGEGNPICRGARAFFLKKLDLTPDQAPSIENDVGELDI